MNFLVPPTVDVAGDGESMIVVSRDGGLTVTTELPVILPFVAFTLVLPTDDAENVTEASPSEPVIVYN